MRRYSDSVSIEFLIKTIAKNLQYIFLILGTLNLLNIIDFNLNPKHFPTLTISSEISKIVSYTYNPIFIYGHYFYVFFSIIKGFALGFFETIKTNWITGAIICILIVNIWLLYNKVSFSYGKSLWKIEGILGKLSKSIWEESNLLERGLWMIFFIDLMVLITTPGRLDILFLLIIYLLILSVKFLPWITHILINLMDRLESTILYNKKVLFAVTFIDIILIYFDSQNLFTLFLIILVYNGVAMLILRLLKEARRLYDYAFYIFNLGMIIFFFSLILIYFIAFGFISLIQSPIIAFYYYKNKKFLPENIIEIINIILLVILFVLF
ncbi:MAG: hypothetical protein KJ623_01100 [Nanoarchaeota archaeon]|nr:hypothetical protein [Nanoarchaeota archaeon]MBU0963193.1 hypothetical protein [Nanoarchaeota archaeon]